MDLYFLQIYNVYLMLVYEFYIKSFLEHFIQMQSYVIYNGIFIMNIFLITCLISDCVGGKPVCCSDWKSVDCLMHAVLGTILGNFANMEVLYLFICSINCHGG